MVLCVLGLLALVFLRPDSGYKEQVARNNCVRNLKNLGFAFRVFATDHADRFPSEVLATNGLDPNSIPIQSIYLALSNGLFSPNLLCCPADSERRPATSFQALTAKNISYFVGLSADETKPQSLLAGDRDLNTNGVSVGPGVLTIATNMIVSPGQKIHRWGMDVAMGDGSVQRFTTNRIRGQMLEGQRLLIP